MRVQTHRSLIPLPLPISVSISPPSAPAIPPHAPPPTAYPLPRIRLCLKLSLNCNRGGPSTSCSATHCVMPPKPGLCASNTTLLKLSRVRLNRVPLLVSPPDSIVVETVPCVGTRSLSPSQLCDLRLGTLCEGVRVRVRARVEGSEARPSL